MPKFMSLIQLRFTLPKAMLTFQCLLHYGSIAQTNVYIPFLSHESIVQRNVYIIFVTTDLLPKAILLSTYLNMDILPKEMFTLHLVQ